MPIYEVDQYVQVTGSGGTWYGQVTALAEDGSYVVRIGGTDSTVDVAEGDLADHPTHRALEIRRVYKDMLSLGEVWGPVKTSTIAELSAGNIVGLTKALGTLSVDEADLVQRIQALPFNLKHNTKAEYAGLEASARIIYSKTELQRRGIDATGGTKIERDQEYIRNEDFVFFRLSMGLGPASSRFGPSCFVFAAPQLFMCGWVSLHDMLNPMASPSMCSVSPQKTLAKREPNPFGGKGWRISSCKGDIITHEYASSKPRQLHKLQEVFYGPDILPGIALSTLLELRNMKPLMALALAERANPEALYNLVVLLFRPEAKIPRCFRFAASELLARHEDVPYRRTD